MFTLFAADEQLIKVVTVPDLTQLILAISTLLGVLGSVIVSVWNAMKHKVDADKSEKKLDDIHQQFNSRMNEMLELKKEEGRTQGQAQERADAANKVIVNVKPNEPITRKENDVP